MLARLARTYGQLVMAFVFAEGVVGFPPLMLGCDRRNDLLVLINTKCRNGLHGNQGMLQSDGYSPVDLNPAGSVTAFTSRTQINAGDFTLLKWRHRRKVVKGIDSEVEIFKSSVNLYGVPEDLFPNTSSWNFD